jgi:nitrous oxide reductase accessory protein NosL
MNKKILIVFVLLLVACSDDPFVKGGNTERVPLKIERGKYFCSSCKMPVDTLKYSAQAVLENGDTYFFDDPGCVALWLNKINNKDNVKIWMYSLDTKRWIDGRKAYYSIVENTPMFYGFGAYENNKTGFISFDEMFIRMIRGENLTNPKIRKQILEDLKKQKED